MTVVQVTLPHQAQPPSLVAVLPLQKVFADAGLTRTAQASPDVIVIAARINAIDTMDLCIEVRLQFFTTMQCRLGNVTPFVKR